MSKKIQWIEDELNSLKEQGLYNHIRTLDSAQGAWLTVDGEERPWIYANPIFLRYGYSSTSDMLAMVLQAASLHAMLGPGSRLAPSTTATALRVQPALKAGALRGIRIVRVDILVPLDGVMVAP